MRGLSFLTHSSLCSFRDSKPMKEGRLTMSGNTMGISEMCHLTPIELESLYYNISAGEAAEENVDFISTSVNVSVDYENEVESNMSLHDFLGIHGNMCENKRIERMISIVVPIIFAIITIVGIVGNVLVLLVVALRQQMRNTTNVLIVNLATSDLLFVTICIPPSALDYVISWPLGDVFCRLVQYMIHVTCYGSIYTLVLLSLDRYLAVVYPVKSISWRTVCNTSIVIFLTWIFTLTTCIPILFVYNAREIEFPHGGTKTICSFDRNTRSESMYQTIFFITSLVIPLIAIIWLYLNMLHRLWKGSAATHGPGPMRDKNACKGKENKLRVTRMIIVVIIVFVVCWLPLQLVLLLKSHDQYSIQTGFGSVLFQIIANCLAYCNSCLNPILYAFFSPNFRAAFLQLVSCGKASHRQIISMGNGNGGNNTGNATANRETTPDRRQSGTNDGKNHKSDVFGNGTDLELQPLVNERNQAMKLRNLSRTEISENGSLGLTEGQITPPKANGHRPVHEVKATLH